MFKKYYLLLQLTMMCFAVSLSTCEAQTASYSTTKSIALVIGQSAYASPNQLANPERDAVAIASTLRDLGFDVTQITNGSRTDIETAFSAFSESSRTADVIFVYYAGHGVQQKGINYLLPVDSSISGNISFEREFISLNRVLEEIERKSKNDSAKIVVIDACRDNPWDKISTSQTGEQVRGLARTSQSIVVHNNNEESGLSGGYFRIIAFSTAAGQTAGDGNGIHSPYTQSLLRFLPQQGLEVGEIFRAAAADVQQETKGVQRPEYIVQTSRPLYLRVPYVTECDRDAIEGQNFLGIQGVPFDDVNPAVSIPACEEAVNHNPQSARLHNNLGRAYEKAERLGDALKQYATAAAAGYAPAINSYGIARLTGCGLRQRDVEGGLKLIVEARRLGNLPARGTLTTHDMLNYISDVGLNHLVKKLKDEGTLNEIISGKRDLPKMALAVKSFQEREHLAEKGLTLETVYALGLFDIVPDRFHCH